MIGIKFVITFHVLRKKGAGTVVKINKSINLLFYTSFHLPQNDGGLIPNFVWIIMIP